MAECVSCGAVIGAGSEDIDRCESCLADDAATASDDSASFSWQAPTSPEQEGQGGGQSEVAEAGVEAQGSHWQAGESKAAVANNAEQQQPSSGGGSLVAALIALVAGVGCLLLPAAGEPLIEAWGPAGFLIFLLAKPVGWILLGVGVILLVVAVSRSMASAPKPKVEDNAEQQQPSRSKGSLLGRLVSIVFGVVFIVSGIGNLLLASGAVPPSGDGQARDVLAYHYAQPLGWLFLVVGVVLIVAPALRSLTSATGKTRRSSAYRWLPGGVILYYLSWPAGALIASSVPPHASVVISAAPLLAVWLVGVAGLAMVLVGLVYFFGDYLEDSGLYPKSRSDWIKIMVVFWVLVGVTESLLAGVVLLAVLGPGLALLRSESKKEKRAKESQADG